MRTYELPEPAEVNLEVFSMQGRRVAVLQSGLKSAGEHIVSFEASNLARGLYVYRLKTANAVKSKK